jgi:hypothetical protein
MTTPSEMNYYSQQELLVYPAGIYWMGSISIVVVDILPFFPFIHSLPETQY